jgi:uncharacterized membrane protein
MVITGTLLYYIMIVFHFSQLVINKQKPFVRFGMMHLMATNICVLIVTAVMETNEDYRQQNYIAKNVTTEGKNKANISTHVIPCHTAMFL